MAVLTELPPEGDNSEDRQIQPMEHEIQNGDDSGRDVGRVSHQHSKQFHISGPDSQLTLTIFRSIINKLQSIQIKCFENCQLEPK